MKPELEPTEVTRQVYQRLLSNQNFDAFVLNLLWQRLSLRTKEVLEISKSWYFGELQVAETWQVPALVIVFRNAALLAHPRYWGNLAELANACRELTLCDRVQVMGNDTCIRLWYDHNGKHWHSQTVPLPADWHPEES